MTYYTFKRPWIEAVEELQKEQEHVTYEEIKEIQDSCDRIAASISRINDENTSIEDLNRINNEVDEFFPDNDEYKQPDGTEEVIIEE